MIRLNGLGRYLQVVFLLSMSGWVDSAVEPESMTDVTVVLSEHGQVYQQVYEGIRSRLSPDINVHLEDITSWNPDPTHGVHVGVGAAATRRLLDFPELSVRLGVLLPSYVLGSLLADNIQAQQAVETRRLSFIYLDQPGERQINFAKLIRPGLKSVGTIYDQSSEQIALQLKAAATETGLSFRMQSLSDQDNPVSVLRRMYADIDVFIAIPAAYIFNGATAKWMLYLSFQNGKPLLGFSSAYTGSGALASVYSDPDDIARQAAQWISNLTSADGTLPRSAYPDYFHVKINQRVAARLKLNNLDASQLEEKLKAMESAR